MMYRDFQRNSPEWPKRIREVEGRRVRLRHPMKTRGGVSFVKGEELWILGAYRGRLALAERRAAAFNERGRSISQVQPCECDLLPEGK